MTRTKARLSPALWVVFLLIDAVIVLGVLAAIFWVAPTPPAFAPSQTMAQARAANPSGMVVVVVTADHCFSCQMYKRGALVDDRVTQWISDNAGAVALKWGRDQDQIDALHVTGYPTTVLLERDAVLAIQTGAMSADDLLVFLESGAEKARAVEGGGSTEEVAGDEPPADR